MFEDIQNDPTWKRFKKLKSASAENTFSSYETALNSFGKFIDKSPTEIHDLHRADLRNRLGEFDWWLSNALDDYVYFLIDSDENYNETTINLYVSRVKGFLHVFKLRPTPTPIISKKSVGEATQHTLTVEDIRKAIIHNNHIYRLLLITLAQTGLTISDALLLDVEDFIKAVSLRGENLKVIEDLNIKEAIYKAKNEDNLIGCFDLRRKKTTNEFYTFVGPETLRNIASELESRDATQLKDESPIFIKDTSKLPNKYKSTHLQDLRLKPSTAKRAITRMHKERGIFPRIMVNGKPRNYFRFHKIRHWYSNQLKYKAGFKTEDVKYLMGQKTGDVIEHYIDPNNYTSLKNNYRKALPFLAINDEILLEENQEAIEQLQKEAEDKDKEIEKLKEHMAKQEKEHKAEIQLQTKAREEGFKNIRKEFMTLEKKVEDNSNKDFTSEDFDNLIEAAKYYKKQGYKEEGFKTFSPQDFDDIIDLLEYIKKQGSKYPSRKLKNKSFRDLLEMNKERQSSEYRE